VVSAKVEGDRMYLNLRQSGDTYMAVPVELKSGQWTLASSEEPVMIAADTPITKDFHGEGAPTGSKAQQETCASNLRQIALGMMMYAADYDERMPIADRWCDVTEPYIKNESIYNCPADSEPWSYAMNFKLSRQGMGKIEMPSDTIMQFETEPSRKNAYDKDQPFPGVTMALPARHGEFNNFAFADGHVKAEIPAAVNPESWRVAERMSMMTGMMSGSMPAPPPPPAFD
jgi:prepilin-type processing-associated H-X9-DG protein